MGRAMSLIYVPNRPPASRERWKFTGRETHWGFTFLIWTLVENPSPRNPIGKRHVMRLDIK